MGILWRSMPTLPCEALCRQDLGDEEDEEDVGILPEHPP